MRPIRTALAGSPATTFESLGKLLSSHRGVTRVSLAALSFTVIVALGQPAPTTQAGPEQAPLVPESLLPTSVGVGIPSGDAVTIAFDHPMDPASVEAALQVLPAQKVELAWNADHTRLSIGPERLWRTDERYLVVVPASARTADGAVLAAAERYVFSTQLAPAVTDVQLAFAQTASAEEDGDATAQTTLAAESTAVTSPETGTDRAPTQTATEVSASSSVTVSFSTAMDEAD
ncbi:MAG TPA: Ig-like domain-containing protein, partial [Candidatus Limnocylindria bacterium]|nr:Ig-like domain-containing protein [Candidatus Limnocylindria bacterium]